MEISGINIYPVKSLPGITLKESEVEERGFKYDRRWMLVDNENMFITQRLFPKLIFIDVQIDNNELTFTHKRKSIGKLRISLTEFPQSEINVGVWEDVVSAVEYSKEVNQWFEEAISFNCKLVYMAGSKERKTETKYYTESKKVSFADGYPYLIIGEESLSYLNKKLEIPVSMDQFRPNIVFDGGKEHVEDDWKQIKIGEVEFAIVKPCARCVITTIDLNSGNKNKEPLRTLSSYRNVNGKIMFGQNAISLTAGKIKVGDQITIQ